MKPATIDIDGQIDLIDRQDMVEPAAADRARQSRLADVMIVLERERVALEQALLARLSTTALSQEIDSLVLELDAAAPKFHIAVYSISAANAGGDVMSIANCALLEGEVAAEVCALIEQRAAHSPTPRWQPIVTAKCRRTAPACTTTAPVTPVRAAAEPATEEISAATSAPTAPADAARRSPRKSIWLHMLFWLLALVILATAYLYVTHTGS